MIGKCFELMRVSDAIGGKLRSFHAPANLSSSLSTPNKVVREQQPRWDSDPRVCRIRPKLQERAVLGTTEVMARCAKERLRSNLIIQVGIGPQPVALSIIPRGYCLQRRV